MDDQWVIELGTRSPALNAPVQLSCRRQTAAEAAPGYRKERLRGRVEAPFLLEDLGHRYKDASVLRYEGCDYQLPLLQGNAKYRCAKSRIRHQAKPC